MRLAWVCLLMMPPSLWASSSIFDWVSEHTIPHTGPLWASLAIAVGVVGLGVRLGWYRQNFSDLVDEELVPKEKCFLVAALDFILSGLLKIAMQILPLPLAQKFFPLIGSLFAFILFANLMGLVPGLGSPTTSIDLNLVLGVLSFFLFNYAGIRYSGAAYFKHLFGPVLAMSIIIFPVELVSLLLRPFTLGLRLTGVVSGDHLMIEIFEHLLRSWSVPFIPLTAILKCLGLVISFVQAYVFAILSFVYIKLSLVEDHH